MKIVVNKCYGGFGISEGARKLLPNDFDEWDDENRDRYELIALIEEHGSYFVSGPYSELEVVEIPDETTDYEITEYDGFEGITYVLDGKLHHA